MYVVVGDNPQPWVIGPGSSGGQRQQGYVFDELESAEEFRKGDGFTYGGKIYKLVEAS